MITYTYTRAMFSYTGNSAETYQLNLTGWDTSKVTNMSDFLSTAGRNATSWTLTGRIKVYATNIESIFENCTNGNFTVDIYNEPSNYTNNVTSIDSIVGTKDSSSNV